jgi:hypothetical protein
MLKAESLASFRGEVQMSRASIIAQSRSDQRLHRAKQALYRSPRTRQLLELTKAFSLEDLHIKTFDVDRVVNARIRAHVSNFNPARDYAKKMCDDLTFCGGEMNNLLIGVTRELFKLKWDFTYDDDFIGEAQDKTVDDLKAAIYGKTK